MHRDLFEQTGIYPHQDGDGQVVVIFAGVAEILTKAEAERRFAYASDRSTMESMRLDQGYGDPLAVKQTTLRAAAYGAALAYKKPK